MPKQKIIIIGVGNTFRGDDGIGPLVIEELRTKKSKNIELHDGAISGLTLLEIIKEYPKAIVIDAVHMGLKPGTVKVFNPFETKINFKNDSLSTHGFGLAEVIKLIPELDIKTDLTIVGVEPQTLEFGQPMSDVVNDKLKSIINIIIKMSNTST